MWNFLIIGFLFIYGIVVTIIWQQEVKEFEQHKIEKSFSSKQLRIDNLAISNNVSLKSVDNDAQDRIENPFELEKKSVAKKDLMFSGEVPLQDSALVSEEYVAQTQDYDVNKPDYNAEQYDLYQQGEVISYELIEAEKSYLQNKFKDKEQLLFSENSLSAEEYGFYDEYSNVNNDVNNKMSKEEIIKSENSLSLDL